MGSYTYTILQVNLDAVENWSKTWLLDFNTSKCSALHVKTAASPRVESYYINGCLLKDSENEKDLGVFIDKTLKPSLQCRKVANRAMSIMRRIKRAYPKMKPDVFLKIYPFFVRPHLEYCIQSWRPFLIKDQLLLENVQRRSTKLVEGLGEIDFHQREQILNLFPISYRQERGDLIMAFRIIRNIDTCLDFNTFFKMATTQHLRGHPWKLSKSRSNLRLRQASFSQRVLNVWNNLPEFVVSAPSVSTFKFRLDLFAKNLNYRLVH
jgi:hypothetical protein